MKNWLLSSTALYAPEGEGGSDAATSPPPPPPVATPTTSPTTRLGASQEISDLLDFDPFEPEQPSGQEGEAKPKTAATPAPAGKETKTGDEQVPPSGSETPPKPDPVAQQLETVANLLRQQTEANAKPKTDAETKPKAPKFNLSIPDGISKALLSSEVPEERSAALVEFSNGLANLIYDETMKEVRANLGEIVRRLPEIARSQVNELTTQADMQRDFWDTFSGATVPEAFRLPRTTEMGQFVALTARSLAMELKAKGQEPGWTPEFRNEIGKRVYAALGRQLPGQTQQQQQARPNGNGAQRTPKPGSFATGQTGRGGDAVQFKNDLEKEIAEVFE